LINKVPASFALVLTDIVLLLVKNAKGHEREKEMMGLCRLILNGGDDKNFMSVHALMEYKDVVGLEKSANNSKVKLTNWAEDLIFKVGTGVMELDRWYIYIYMYHCMYVYIHVIYIYIYIYAFEIYMSSVDVIIIIHYYINICLLQDFK
jgi:hypothetical protein